MAVGLGHSERISFRHIIEREIYSLDNSFWESIIVKASVCDQIAIVNPGAEGGEEKVDYDGYREEDNSHSNSGGRSPLG